MSRRLALGAGAALVLFHLTATTLVTRPAALHLQDSLFGAPRGDKYLFLWVFWWVEHALVDLRQLPFATQLQYYPTGVSLVLHDMTWFWSLLALPLQQLFDPRLLLDAFLLLSLPLNGLAFFRMAREVTGSRWGALAGSTVFAYCPYAVARFQLSQVSLVGVFFAPLFFLSLWRYRRDGRGRHLVKAGVLLALQSLTSWYYGVALGLAGLGFAAWQLAASRTRWGEAAFWGRFARHGAAGAAAAGLLLAPFALPILGQLRAAEYRGASTRSGYAYLEASSGDLLSYFVPSYTSAGWWGWDASASARALRDRLQAALRGNAVEKTVYPGWVSWAALAVGLALPALRRRYAAWMLLALGFFALSLGPTLQCGGARLLEGWLPARGMASLPILNLVRGPARFAVFVTLGAGVVLAGAIAQLERARGARAAATAALAASALALFEFAPAPVNVFPRDLWRSPFYQTLRDEPGEFSLLNVPVDFEGALGGGDLYGYAQTIHQRPIVGGYVSREPDAVRAPLRESALLRALHQRQYEGDKRLRLDAAGLADLRPTLERLRVRYVVLHRALLRGSEWQRVDGWLAPHLEGPVYEDRWIRVYAAPSPGPSDAG